jgi:hypothetical protein
LDRPCASVGLLGVPKPAGMCALPSSWACLKRSRRAELELMAAASKKCIAPSSSFSRLSRHGPVEWAWQWGVCVANIPFAVPLLHLAAVRARRSFSVFWPGACAFLWGDLAGVCVWGAAFPWPWWVIGVRARWGTCQGWSGEARGPHRQSSRWQGTDPRPPQTTNPLCLVGRSSYLCIAPQKKKEETQLPHQVLPITYCLRFGLLRFRRGSPAAQVISCRGFWCWSLPLVVLARTASSLIPWGA